MSDSLQPHGQCSTPGLPVHHQLPELTRTHVHWVGDAIQPSHPLSSPSPPAFNLCQDVTGLTLFHLIFIKGFYGASLVVQWLRICLAMQGTLVQSLSLGRSHMSQGNEAWMPQLLSLPSGDHEPQREKPLQWEAYTQQLENIPFLQGEKAHMPQEDPVHRR